MKLSKKISALLSCILACSYAKPAMVNARYDYEEQDDELENEENGNMDLTTPLCFLGIFLGGIYGINKGVKVGQRYHARNMFTGHAWEIFMNSSDKKLIYDTVNRIKFFALSTAYENIPEAIEDYNNDLEDTDDYRKLEFNLLKLCIFDTNFLDRVKNQLTTEIEIKKWQERYKVVKSLFDGNTIKADLGNWKKNSDDAVGCMNEILNGDKTISNLGDEDQKLLEKNKKIIEFIDKIGPKDCTELLRNCGNIQIAPLGNNKLEIEWYKNGSGAGEDPYSTLTFDNPDANPVANPVVNPFVNPVVKRNNNNIIIFAK